jgi:hypothetical protein
MSNTETKTILVRTVLLLTLISLLPFMSLAQKTVRVREYRRKDGTVVRTHTRRAPRSSSQPTPPVVIEYDPEKAAEPRVVPLSERSRILTSEPYEVVDLGGGSTYTPGGTGTTRLRWAIKKER